MKLSGFVSCEQDAKWIHDELDKLNEWLIQYMADVDLLWINVMFLKPEITELLKHANDLGLG